MDINSELKEGLLNQIELAIDGKVTFIPNQMEKMGHVFNLLQSRFILLGAQSGVGKTSYVDDAFLLKVWDAVRDTPEIRWDVLYFSLERKKLFKHAKMLSWMLYRDKGWKLDPNILLGWSNTKLTPNIKKEIDRLMPEISDLLGAVNIFDGRTSVKRMAIQIKKKARELGVLYRTDQIGVKRDDETSYITTFKQSQYDITKNGKLLYLTFTHNNKEYKLYQDKHIYILHNPNTFFFIFVDGLGLMDDTGYKGTKQALDATINLLSDARDIYGASPVVVSQFNRGISDIHRVKLHAGNNEPQESDFKDTSNAYQAADLVLGLFDPVRAKAYDKKGMYLGYDVLSGMKSKMLKQYRFRSLKVLKNSFGVDNITFPLKFLGEVSVFSTLPHYEKTELLQKEYLIIKNGN